MLFESRKSQAAMEYMHTYGWVILVAMVLSGALVYYNMNTESVLPNECSFLSGIRCTDIDTSNDLFAIVLINEFGFTMSNLTLSISGTCNSTANTSDGNPYGNPVVFPEHTQAMFIFECQNLSNLNVEEDVSIEYVNFESGQAHTKVGSLSYSPGE